MFQIFKRMTFVAIGLFVAWNLLLTAPLAHAATVYYRWASSPAVTCEPHGAGVWAIFASQPIEWANIPAGAQIRYIYASNDAVETEGPFPIVAGTGSQIFGSLAIRGHGYPLNVSLRIETIVEGSVIYSSTLSGSCGGDGGGTSSVSSLVITGSSLFSGPALPINRNLVVFVKDTPVYGTPPGGKATSNSMKTCQTAFVLETSADGKWGRIFVMGGWIPLSMTVDVAENYGQTGGQTRLAGCENK